MRMMMVSIVWSAFACGRLNECAVGAGVGGGMRWVGS
jgi:hypothetical protein